MHIVDDWVSKRDDEALAALPIDKVPESALGWKLPCE